MAVFAPHVVANFEPSTNLTVDSCVLLMGGCEKYNIPTLRHWLGALAEQISGFYLLTSVPRWVAALQDIPRVPMLDYRVLVSPFTMVSKRGPYDITAEAAGTLMEEEWWADRTL
jgi:hypothetical protein